MPLQKKILSQISFCVDSSPEYFLVNTGHEKEMP